jgi:hypothetical protein
MGNSAVQMEKKRDELKLGEQETAPVPTFVNNSGFMWHSGWTKVMFHSIHILAREREAPRKDRSRKHKMQSILRNNQIALKPPRAENEQK